MRYGIKDCIRSYASKTGCSLAEADKAMRTSLEVIKEAILEGGVAFIGTFTIDVVQRQDRKGINPSTGELHVIPAHKTLKLTVGKQLKEELNK